MQSQTVTLKFIPISVCHRCWSMNTLRDSSWRATYFEMIPSVSWVELDASLISLFWNTMRCHLIRMGATTISVIIIHYLVLRAVTMKEWTRNKNAAWSVHDSQIEIITFLASSLQFFRERKKKRSRYWATYVALSYCDRKLLHCVRTAYVQGLHACVSSVWAGCCAERFFTCFRLSQHVRTSSCAQSYIMNAQLISHEITNMCSVHTAHICTRARTKNEERNITKRKINESSRHFIECIR